MKKYWDRYYNDLNGVLKPSSFSKYCKKFLKNYKGDIYDIGCGNGRDTIFFNQNKINCIGLDQSSAVIKLNKKKFKKIKKNFIKTNFVNFPYKNKNKSFSIYSRFTLHSINKKQEKILIKKMIKLKKLDYLFIEARTIYDELFGIGKKIGKNEYVTSHYRRFINPKELKKEIKKNFKIIEFKVSRGFAIFKKENPKVLRIIAKKLGKDN